VDRAAYQTAEWALNGEAALTFTNYRLISPNPTGFIGLATYRQLLGMAVLTVDPVTDACGTVLMKDGASENPTQQSLTRNNPDYPHLQGMRAWARFDWGPSKLLILERDVVFMTAIMNTFIFVMAPLLAGLALGLALLTNP
jgi:multiple sugar transport system permease protein